MKEKGALSWIAILATAGVLFSGYLTYYTYATGQPGCELFILGMPSCFYGLIMYAIVFFLAFNLAAKARTRNAANSAMTILGGIGILFAGYLTAITLGSVSCTSLEILGVPPCVYGLAMYLALLLLALTQLRTKR